EVMELPHLFRTTLDALPARVPYLHPPSGPPRPAPAKGGDAPLAVGLVWRVGDWEPRRSIPFASLRPLAAVPGVTLHILQRGRGGLEERPPGFGVLSGSDDILAAARVMTTLDLIVSVDSMPAHLAGALGLPVWTLLPCEA